MKNNKKEKGNFPILRFPDFQGEWEDRKLGEIAELTSSKRIYLSEYVDNGIPFYRGKEISELKQNIQPKDILYISSALYNEYKTKYGVPRINDILITAVGTLGNVFVIRNNDPFYFKDGNLIWLKNVSVNSDFLMYLLEVNKNKLESSAIGSSQKALTMVELRKLTFIFPPNLEQNKIAVFLSLMDKRIQTQIKIIEELRLLKCVLLKKTFFQELRFPEFNKNWKTVRLGDVGTFFSGGTPLTSMKLYYNGDIPFIKSGEINADCTEQFISEEGLKNSSAKMIEIGDLIYALYGATSGEVEISKIKGAINQAVLCIRTILNNIFLLNYLTFKKDEILRTYLQGGQGNLSAEIIKSLRVPMPINAEQTKLAYLFSAFDKKVELEINIMEKLKQQKQYFLANLFI